MVSTTVSPSVLPWLRNNLRLEGLAYQFVPMSAPDPDTDALESNLMAHYRYRGYNDPGVYLDETSRAMSQNLYAAFVTLAGALRDIKDEERCAEIMATMQAALPTERIQPSEQIMQLITSTCERR